MNVTSRLVLTPFFGIKLDTSRVPIAEKVRRRTIPDTSVLPIRHILLASWADGQNNHFLSNRIPLLSGLALDIRIKFRDVLRVILNAAKNPV